MISSSLLIPVAGLATAPLLAHSLGVAARGELAAASAPNTLIAGVATLGLPDALAYMIARRPYLRRRLLLRSSLWAGSTGLVAVLITAALSSYLAQGDAHLAMLITMGAALAVPALMVGLLRGAAAGAQRWKLVAWERGLGSLIRLIGLLVLAATGHLNVLYALFLLLISAVIAGGVYLPLLRRSIDIERSHPSSADHGAGLDRQLLGYGSRVWLGGVATVVVGRSAQLLIVPLSDLRQLGLYIVGITISDASWIVVASVRDVVFGSSAADLNSARAQRTSRLTTAFAASSSVALGLTMPFWIGSMFGSEFRAALPATWVLLISSAVVAPGLISGAVVAAAGHPGARTAAIVCGFVTNALGLVCLVPLWGALGAALAGLACNMVVAIGCLIAARRVTSEKGHYLVLNKSDIRWLSRMVMTRMINLKLQKAGRNS